MLDENMSETLAYVFDLQLGAARSRCSIPSVKSNLVSCFMSNDTYSPSRTCVLNTSMAGLRSLAFSERPYVGALWYQFFPF